MDVRGTFGRGTFGPPRVQQPGSAAPTNYLEDIAREIAHPTAAAPTARAVMQHEIPAERPVFRPHHPAHAPLDRPQRASFPLCGSDIDAHGAVLDFAAGSDHREFDPVGGVTVSGTDKYSAARHRSEQRDPLYSWDRSHG